MNKVQRQDWHPDGSLGQNIKHRQQPYACGCLLVDDCTHHTSPSKHIASLEMELRASQTHNEALAQGSAALSKIIAIRDSQITDLHKPVQVLLTRSQTHPWVWWIVTMMGSIGFGVWEHSYSAMVFLAFLLAVLLKAVDKPIVLEVKTQHDDDKQV